MKRLLILAGVLIAGVALFRSNSNDTSAKKSALLNWMAVNDPGYSTTFAGILDRMSASEISVVYTYLFDYWQNNIEVPGNSVLYNQVQQISDKYNLFT